jgi:hypothetical protein
VKADSSLLGVVPNFFQKLGPFFVKFLVQPSMASLT